jgi:hypothetical protein
MEDYFDILIVGGGVGGCAAAIAASSLGLRVALTEETMWLGGQFSSQAVPPDEHRWVEAFGRTRRYRSFRDRIRDFYRRNTPLNERSRNNPTLNPGGGSVSRLCFEPRTAVLVLEEMMSYAISSGCLSVFFGRKPVGAYTEGDHVETVRLMNTQTGVVEHFSATYFIDATELGDLLPMTQTEYVSGAEAAGDTGEMHASPQRDSNNVQAFTWCMAVGYDPESEYRIEKPSMYQFWKSYQPDLRPVSWTGSLLNWTYPDPFTLKPVTRSLFGPPDWHSLFKYRQIIDSSIYSLAMPPCDTTILNWPQNDYIVSNVIDKSSEVVERSLSEAKELTLSLFYWLQNEAPRPDGGCGYAGLFPRGDVTGTADGLAMAPYFRESRRICAVQTVKEEHVGAEMLEAAGLSRAARFSDSVGVGYYRIDLHPTTAGDNYVDVESKPFQIPLGALLPVRVQNLLPACKNIGTTHVTNGCFRLHPVEWNIGESVGLLSAFCILREAIPHEVYSDSRLFSEYADLLDAEGIERAWPEGM